jgi:hypothetical protein
MGRLGELGESLILELKKRILHKYLLQSWSSIVYRAIKTTLTEGKNYFYRVDGELYAGRKTLGYRVDKIFFTRG